MIGSVRGRLLVSTPLAAVIDVGGIGYEVSVPVTTAERMPGIGSEALLFTHAVYREDSQALYGFSTVDERDFFRLLVSTVSGVGPKVALALMSRFSLELLESTIVSGDADSLSRCPGIGRKTADRIILDLQDKLVPKRLSSKVPPSAMGSGAGPVGSGSPVADAVAALVALGYKPADAEKSVRKAHAALGEASSTEALIKRALS